MAEIILDAKKREITTKGAINQLRRDGMVPCVYYEKGKDAISFSVLGTALNPLVYTSDTNTVVLKLDGTDYRCILKDIQFDPITDKIIHVDFRGITAGEKIDIEVPVKLVGNPIGVKEGGKLQVGVHKLDLKCLPKDIPSNIEIDISELKIGDSIHVKDLDFEKFELLTDDSVVVVSVSTSRNVEEGTAEEEGTEEVSEETEDAEKTEE